MFYVHQKTILLKHLLYNVQIRERNNIYAEPLNRCTKISTLIFDTVQREIKIITGKFQKYFR